jgi:hypothetical protein
MLSIKCKFPKGTTIEAEFSESIEFATKMSCKVEFVHIGITCIAHPQSRFDNKSTVSVGVDSYKKEEKKYQQTMMSDMHKSVFIAESKL